MEIHVLNGDALKEQFPASLSGQKIVARECLVDGDVTGGNLQQLFDNRARFLETDYKIPAGEYQRVTVPEFQKILKLPDDAVVNLWFEDDLFCQVNFWFVASLLSKYTSVKEVHLVRPSSKLQFGFGGMDETALVEAYGDRKRLSQDLLKELGELWSCYPSGDDLALQVEEVSHELPFVVNAVKAHIARQPSESSPGAPIETLLAIIKELETEEFGQIFTEFNKRESIYGFGDLQVRRLLDGILSKR